MVLNTFFNTCKSTDNVLDVYLSERGQVKYLEFIWNVANRDTKKQDTIYH